MYMYYICGTREESRAERGCRAGALSGDQTIHFADNCYTLNHPTLPPYMLKHPTTTSSIATKFYTLNHFTIVTHQLLLNADTTIVTH